MVTPLAPQQLAGILPRQAVRMVQDAPGRRLSAWRNWRLSACSGCRCNTWQGSGTFWG